MSLQVSSIMLGVQDLTRAKASAARLTRTPRHFVSFSLGEGSPRLALYEWEAAARDAGVSAEGSGFRGASFHVNPDSRDMVDEIMCNAVAAGGSVVKEAAPAQWGGYFGYFSDPDGYLWKVTTYAS